MGSYVSRVLRLTLLAPDIVEAILNGRQPEGMTLLGLMRGVAVEWEGQAAGSQAADAAEAGNCRGDC